VYIASRITFIGFPDNLGVLICDTFKIERDNPLKARKIEKPNFSKYSENMNKKTRIIVLLSIANPVYFASLDKPKVLK
jgi:hypothetical protein